MRNKKILIPLIAMLVVITVLIVVLLLLMGKNKNTTSAPASTEQPTPTTSTQPSSEPEPEEIDLSNVDEEYSEVAIAFANALSETKSMEKFLELYVDPTAFVAYTKCKGNIEDFFTVFEAVEEEEADEITEAFKEMISKNDSFEVIKMSDITELGDDDTFTSSEVTIRNSDGKQATMVFVFYKGDEGQIVINIKDSKGDPITKHSDEFLDYFIEVEKKEDAKKDDKEESIVEKAGNQMSQQEVDMYNAKLKAYEGEIKGSELKSMIDTLISQNNSNAGEALKFISISATITNFSKNADLEKACKTAYEDNSEENVEAASTIMSELKSKVNSAKNYNAEFEYKDGIIVKITVTEA